MIALFFYSRGLSSMSQSLCSLKVYTDFSEALLVGSVSSIYLVLLYSS